LEAVAHEARVLPSTDAIKYLIANCGTQASETLETVVARAKQSYPSEDGWVVINLERLEQLLENK